MSKENKLEKPANKRPNRTNPENAEKPLPSGQAKVVSTEEPTVKVREWASHLSAETRNASWIDDGYVMPDEVSALCRRLASERGGLHALIGYQGVGKTSAMLSIPIELRKPRPAEPNQKAAPSKPIFLFKWDRLGNLTSKLLRQSDNLGEKLRRSYYGSLQEALDKKTDLKPKSTLSIRESLNEISQQITLLQSLTSLDFSEAEKRLGRNLVERLRYESFLRTLGQAQAILIDLPDYSKTDMRRVSSDLEAIYWIWNELAHLPTSPNVVISFQKEMFRGHYFLGKMNRIELKPLKPEKLVEACKKRFPEFKVFTEDALLLVARMGRGIFRRFLRYITLALDHQERTSTPLPITTDQVREAIPPHILAEDMDQQLTEIFPRQPDMRTEAVKLLQHLEEHGQTAQTKIKELLHVPDYTVSRLVNKLEDYRYVKRERKGIENIIALETP